MRDLQMIGIRRTILLITVFIMFMPIMSLAGTVNLPRTGQTTSYASGDDGHIQAGVAWSTPRFTDNGDGTVTDNLTGLMWLKDANCIKSNYPDFDKDERDGDGMVTWQHVLDFVAGINAGTYSNCGAGYTDWRFPNRKELYSLIDFGRGDLPSGHPFTNVRAAWHWSSTTNASDKARAYAVAMRFGHVLYPYKFHSYVR